MFNIFNMRKSASSKDIIMDFAKAWQTLNTKLIEKHLSSDFIYDSQWVFESLDYKGYIKYIRGKFKTLRRNRNNIDVQIVSVSELEGVISIQQNKGEPVFYVIKIKKGKVVKGDLCMFGLFSFGLRKTGLPLIITSGKLKNLCFLIDTGATHNVLFSYVYEHFKDEFKTLSEKQNIMGIEGHYKETPTIEATFNFEGIDYTSIFSVLDATDVVQQIQEETGMQIHGILSTNFLLENKWIIDFENLIIRK